MSRKILVTSALPYANGPLHLGHLVETIQTDIWVRFQRKNGHTCHYFCADDAHGTPVMLAAKKLDKAPEVYVEEIRTQHQADFKEFLVEFDYYHSTHSPENKQLSEAMYAAAQQANALIEKEIEQYFCPNCTIFLPDRFIKGECPHCHAPDQYGDSCEKCASTYDPIQLISPKCATCDTPPVLKKTTHLFFKVSQFQDQIKSWLDHGAVPETQLNKLNEWFTQGLKDWCISRDAPYFGFEIPGKPGKFFYVWMDAPVGYMATTLAWAQQDQAAFDRLWKSGEFELHHFIGKDILYFHALFWPAMLLAGKFPLPKQLHVHGFLTVNGEKMSKSRGTFIKARDYLDKLPPEYLRYYLASKLTASAEDLDFSADDFLFKVNADIVNKVVNIGSRLGSVIHKKCGGKLTQMDEAGQALLDSFNPILTQIQTAYDTLELATAMRLIMGIADQLNKFIDESAPWSVANTDPDQAAKLCTTGLNGLYRLATLLSPVLPRITDGVSQFLNAPLPSWEDISTTTLTDHPIVAYQHLAKRLEKAEVAQVLGG